MCMLTPYLPNAAITIAIFCLVAMGCLIWLHTITLIIAEVFPVKNVASVLGIAGGFGALGAVIFNHFVGQYMGTLDTVKIFTVMAFLHPIALVLLWTLVQRERPKVIVV